jgi:prepilin-type processing-associated H-X9-DG protein
MNNEKQMTLAWVTYADDFVQNLVPNVGDGQAQQYYDPTNTWCYGNVSALPDETNTMWLMQGLLWPYAKAVGIYKCPSDPGAPPGTPRVRGISMNGYMNGKGGGTDAANYENFMRIGDLLRPSQYFVFLDEKPASINDEYFEVIMSPPNSTSLTLHDDPSQVHSFACGFGFADGHAEIHKWLSGTFRSPSVFAGTFNQGTAEFNDTYWLTQHTTYSLH